MKRLALAALIVGLSCGGSDADGPVDMSPQGVCDFYAGRFCSGSQKCEPLAFGFYYDDFATCKSGVSLNCQSRLVATGTNVTPSGTVACANAVGKLSCEDYRDFERWPEPCIVPPGKLADDAGCVLSSQCEGGDCVIKSDERCGVCRTAPRAGEACIDTDCLNFIPCINGVCVLPPKLGDPCNAGDLYCIEGLVCRNIDASGMGTCERLLPTGSACDPQAPGGEECDYTNYDACDTKTRTCQPVTYRSPVVGMRCEDPRGCNLVSHCDDNFICQLNPREGEPCNYDALTPCLFPAKCIDGVCTIRDAAQCR